MKLLDKFSAVEVKADNRIMEEDKYFCEQHQAAYEAARTSFQELAYIWSDIEDTQSKLLAGLGDSSYAYKTYLTSEGGPEIDDDSLKKHIVSLHTRFIETIVYYFNSKYHVTADIEPIKEHILPQQPRDRWDEDGVKVYGEAMQSLRLRYQDILDQILVQLDGRGFVEQAFYELKESCHRAAWSSYDHKAKYELKRDILRFPDYGCHYESWYSSEHWELRDGLKNIMRGLAHFESGSFSAVPSELAPLVGYGRFEYNQIDFSFCQKVCQLKMFKNGRVDLKFANAECAQEFVNTYLGTVL